MGRTMWLRGTLSLLVWSAASVVLAAGSAPVNLPGLFGVSSVPAGYSEEYQEMNLKMSQVDIVRKIPFVGLTPSERLTHLQTYVGDVRGGNIKGAARAVKGDFTQGHFVKDVGVALATSVFTRVAQGATIDQAVTETWDYVSSSEFFFGQFLGGLGGAAIGAMVPVPMFGGLLGQALGGAPLLGGAMLGGQLGYGLVSQIKEGHVDIGALFKSVDYLGMVCQTLGCALGMTYGAFLPIPGFGSVVGGMIGGSMGMKLATWIRERIQGAAASAAVRPAEESAGATGSTTAAVVAADPAADATADPAAVKAARDAAYRDFVAAQERGDALASAEALERLRQTTLD